MRDLYERIEGGAVLTGVLLVQLGTPDAPTTSAVRRYLREFLGDPRVIDSSAVARWLLVNAIILPFRSPRSARQYRKIWTGQGSPLLVHSRALEGAVSEVLGPDFHVELGMRYGEPRLSDALDRLVGAEVDRIVVLPLFPMKPDPRRAPRASEPWNSPASAGTFRR